MPDSCDFTFHGHHIREFGAVFLPERWPGAAATAINDVSVGGRHGTLRYPGQTFGEKTLSGRLYLISPDDEPLSYAAMLARAEALCGWLKTGGRGPLILDAAPERLYMAEVKGAISFTTEEWPSGCAEVAFTLQPFAYALRDTAISLTLSPGREQSVSLYVPGNQPAPLLLTLTASGPLSALRVEADGQTLAFEGLGLGAGGILRVAAPLDTGEVMTCEAGGGSGMCRITAQSAVPFWLRPGARRMVVQGDGAGEMRLGVRGRWV